MINKTLAQICRIMASLWLASCGVKQPPPAEGPVLPPTVKKADTVLAIQEEEPDSLKQMRNNELALKLKKIRSFELDSLVKHNDSLASTGEDFYAACNKWGMSAEQIKQVFAVSQPISGREWHYLYDVFPCYYRGKAKLNGISLRFMINSGSYFIISNNDTMMFYGYTGKKYRNLFMSEPWDGKE